MSASWCAYFSSIVSSSTFIWAGAACWLVGVVMGVTCVSSLISGCVSAVLFVESMSVFVDVAGCD
jgi:hypothetical protein